MRPDDLRGSAREGYAMWRRLGLSEETAMRTLEQDGLITLTEDEKFARSFQETWGLSRAAAEIAARGRDGGSRAASSGVSVAELAALRADPTYNGDIDEGEEVLRPLREFGPPLADQIGPMPYAGVQTMLDDAFPRGRQYYWKAHLISDVSDAAIDVIIKYFAATPSPFTLLGLQQLGNAANRVAQDETAFSHRDALYDFLMLSGWEDPSEAERNIEWTRELYDAMQPSLHPGIYVNAVGADSPQMIRAAYRPETYERLVALKEKYDPLNLFRLNPNIEPTVSGESTISSASTDTLPVS